MSAMKAITAITFITIIPPWSYFSQAPKTSHFYTKIVLVIALSVIIDMIERFI